ncbi:MAG: hypothetical protein AAGK32_15510, partial [Actinomycetota bacterium]
VVATCWSWGVAEPYAVAARSITEAVCGADIDVLDLSDQPLEPGSFSDPLHFSAAGADRLSVLTGRWLRAGAGSACR